jgi:hypothetical protein
MTIVAAFSILLTTAFAQNYVRLESPANGRTYTVDLDTTGVQRALHPVQESAVAARLPSWLYPGPAFKPSNLHWDPITGIVSGTFITGGTVEQLSAFYEQTFHSQGLRVSSLPYRGSAGLQLTGSSTSATVTVQIQPQSGSTRAIATYAPRSAPRQHFTVVWYDDKTGVLRVRDAAGGEYELDKRGITANNLNRPGGVASETAALPSWLPMYPRAAASPKGRIRWMFTPTAEFVTGDPIRSVYEYYLEQVRAAGAMIKSSGINRSGTPLKDFDAYVVAIKGDDQVEIRIGELIEFQVGLPSKASGPRTGIGIRYTVPKR